MGPPHPPGRPFEDYIEERVAESHVVVVLWSPHSVASSRVRIEAAHGRDRNPSALIPILIAQASIPFAFRHLHAADLCAWQPGDRGVEFGELLSSIDRLAPRPAAPPRPSEPVLQTDNRAVSDAVPSGPGVTQQGALHLTERNTRQPSEGRAASPVVRAAEGSIAPGALQDRRTEPISVPLNLSRDYGHRQSDNQRLGAAPNLPSTPGDLWRKIPSERRNRRLVIVAVVGIVAAITIYLFGVPPLGRPASENDGPAAAADVTAAGSGSATTSQRGQGLPFLLLSSHCGQRAASVMDEHLPSLVALYPSI